MAVLALCRARLIILPLPLLRRCESLIFLRIVLYSYMAASMESNAIQTKHAASTLSSRNVLKIIHSLSVTSIPLPISKLSLGEYFTLPFHHILLIVMIYCRVRRSPNIGIELDKEFLSRSVPVRKQSHTPHYRQSIVYLTLRNCLNTNNPKQQTSILSRSLPIVRHTRHPSDPSQCLGNSLDPSD
jgi:hypothetical protein